MPEDRKRSKLRKWKGWRWLSAAGIWVLAAITAWVGFGSVLYADWWRAFFWDNGFRDRALWNIGIITVKQEFGQFWPIGGVLVICFGVLLLRSIFLYGKHGKGWMKHWEFLGRPNKNVAAYSPVLLVCIILGLWFRRPTSKDLFWLAKDSERASKIWSQRLQALWSGIGPQEEFAPPTDGVFLYLNDECVLRQYRAISPPLVVHSTKETVTTNKDLGVDGKVMDFGVSGHKETGKESEVVKEAPAVTAPFAAVQLLNMLVKATNVIRFNFPYWSVNKAYMEALQREGVVFSEEQKKVIAEAERTHYLQDTLKTDHEKSFLYEGPIRVMRRGTNVEMEFQSEGLVNIHGKGIIKPECFHEHLSLAAQYANPESAISTVRLYGIIETRKVIATSQVDLDFTPYIMW